MQIAQLKDWEAKFIEIFEAHGAADAAHDSHHFRRVWRLAQEICATEPEADKLVVLAASFFHDCVSLPKNHPDRSKASTLAAEKAVGMLREFNFPEEKLAGVAHAIEAHSFSAGLEAKTLEAKIVRDADRLEALGAIGVARVFTVGAAIRAAPFHSADPFAENRELNDREYTLDHFYTKLFQLERSLKTEHGRKLGRERTAFMHGFVEQLRDELRT